MCGAFAPGHRTSTVIAWGNGSGRKGTSECPVVPAVCFGEDSCSRNRRRWGSAPAPPSVHANLPLASCQRLPSGRHRTGKLDGASGWGNARMVHRIIANFVARVSNPCSTSRHGLKTRATENSASEPREAPTSLRFGVFRRGAASRDAGGSAAGCGGGAGAEPLRLRIDHLRRYRGINALNN